MLVVRQGGSPLKSIFHALSDSKTPFSNFHIEPRNTMQTPLPPKRSGSPIPVAAVAAALLAFPSLTTLVAQSIVTEYPVYFVDEGINIDFSKGPGNPKDWVGIYPLDIVPGSVASTRWDYVDDTQNGNTGLTEGRVNLPGLAAAGDWTAHLLLNDGYTILSQTNFTVVDLGTPLVRIARSIAAGSSFDVQFFNAPGNTKDWLGIYKEGETPGAGALSTLWYYLDGTQSGGSAVTEGTISFNQGLGTAGTYRVYLLENDGYTILAGQQFVVAEAAADGPRILSLSPAPGATGLAPVLEFSARITNSAVKVDISSIELQLDGAKVAPTITDESTAVVVQYRSATLPAPSSTHKFTLQFKDTANPAKSQTAETSFTIGTYVDVRLPAPIAGTFESFDAVPEGQVPAGWTVQNFTTSDNEIIDFGDLNSVVFADWISIDVERFKGSFVTYGNPDNPQTWEDDYHRVLTANPFNVLNGVAITGPLANGRMLFADSGYRNGAGQIQFVTTPDYDLTGKTDVHVAFKSLWEQNQDSLAALEFSTDKGATWLPVFYLLVGGDIVTTTDEITGATTVDAEATFTTELNDIARWIDPDTGETLFGTYGSFIKAPITPALAPFIQARDDDNPASSKRIELHRLTQADNQKTVRFRFATAGTDSWYWGIDDFGLYSITGTSAEPPKLTLARSGADWILSWTTAEAGFVLESSPSLTSPAWTAVSGVTGSQLTITTTDAARFYRFRKP